MTNGSHLNIGTQLIIIASYNNHKIRGPRAVAKRACNANTARQKEHTPAIN